MGLTGIELTITMLTGIIIGASTFIVAGLDGYNGTIPGIILGGTSAGATASMMVYMTNGSMPSGIIPLSIIPVLTLLLASSSGMMLRDRSFHCYHEAGMRRRSILMELSSDALDIIGFLAGISAIMSLSYMLLISIII